jgi:zinc/manganese transport system substrate-binding protein
MRYLLLLILFVSLGAVAAPINVVATLPVLADIAKKIGGDLVDVKSLAQPNQDPHFVTPVPTLMKKAHNADVFIENGLSLEPWVQRIVDDGGNPRIQTGKPGRVVASRGIAAKEVPRELSRAHGDIHPGGNPHVWLDPLNAKIIARNISEGLSNVDPSHKTAYAAGLTKFESDVDSRMAGWMKKAASLKGKQIVTYHKSFVYFADRFGFTVASEIEEKPGITPSARHRDALVARMKADKIDTILMEIFYDKKGAPNFIAEKTDARIVQVPIDVGAHASANDYFSLIDHLLDSLKPRAS